MFIFCFPLYNYFLFFSTSKLNMLLQTLDFSNIAFSHISLACMALCFNSFNICTFDSKPRHLACQISFYVYSSIIFCLTFFKHYVIDSILYLCPTNVVVSTSPWWTATFFISSTTQMNVPSTIMKFYSRAFRVSLASFSSSWVFSNFCWVSWSFWSNCLWANMSLASFFSHFYLWASNSRGSM